MGREPRKGCGGALDERQVAELINISVSLLRKWRRLQDGPPWVKLGRVVRYLETDLRAWLEARTVTTSSAEGRRQ
jgi:predicted DNA-binding transcriptional regulator AlpA